SVLRHWPASGRVSDRAALRVARAGVQLAPAVRPIARRRALREDAGRDPRARPRAAGLAQPQPGRLRDCLRDAPVQRPRGRSRVEVPLAREESPMSVAAGTERIPPCSGRALELEAGDTLVIIDPEREQVSDLTAFAREDLAEYLSSGRSIDYASKLWLTTGDVLYSNRSRPMFTIVEDTCGRHDFTLTPC